MNIKNPSCTSSNPGHYLDLLRHSSTTHFDLLRLRPSTAPFDTALRLRPSTAPFDTALRHRPSTPPFDTALRHRPSTPLRTGSGQAQYKLTNRSVQVLPARGVPHNTRKCCNFCGLGILPAHHLIESTKSLFQTNIKPKFYHH